METSNLICTANQINQTTGVYMKWNTGLKCVDDLQTLTMLRNPISTNIFVYSIVAETWKVLKREDVLKNGINMPNSLNMYLISFLSPLIQLSSN